MRGNGRTVCGGSVCSAAGSSWAGTDSGAGSTSISATHCRRLSPERRTALYPELAPVANRWNAAMGIEVQYPPNMPTSSRGATRPGSGSRRRCCCSTARTISTVCTRICTGSTSSRCRWRFSCPSPDGTSPAASSCSPSSGRGCSPGPRWCPLRQGDAVAFAVHHRPVRGTRGVYRVNLRHGVSRIHSGRRHTLGIIFHDAE